MTHAIAFALAGLGGFNAHGAGFLTAARKLGVTPDLVTATSGQIIVLAEWLRSPDADLKALLINPSRPSGVAGTLLTALTGDAGIFRPATLEYWQRWSRFPKTPADFAAQLFPAQEFVPLRSQGDFEAVAAQLNAAPFGVVFNAYDPEQGLGVLFGNARASKLWSDGALRPITAEAVAASLWLDLYGFDGRPGGLVDGAYHRPCIVAELHAFERIFVARPLAQGWRGKVPKSWFDMQDWQTEMWFSAGYAAEVADMRRINTLIDRGGLTDTQYRKIDLIEVATRHPAGYFNYFSERPEVFDEAYRTALEALGPYAQTANSR
jgi:hypothetical protein